MDELAIHIGDRPVTYTGTARTRVYGVVGHPVRHSLSPVFQGAALRALGLDAVYLAFDLQPAEIGPSVARMRQSAGRGVLAGVNVTLPHKRAILSFLDALDEQARLAGAVNTLCFEGEATSARPTAASSGLCVRGANTDVEGLLAALADESVSLAGVPVVIVGAGGMARAAVVAALHAGATEVRVLNRTVARARDMLEEVSAAWTRRLPRLVYAGLDAPSRPLLAEARVLIQATSLGLDPGAASPVDLAGAPPELFVFESVYTPPESALLRAARARGLRGVNGLGLLLHQGARALGRWTGMEPPLAIMRRSLGLAADRPA